MKFRALVLIAVLGACGKDQCQLDADALGQLLAHAETGGPHFYRMKEVTPVTRTDLPRRDLDFVPEVVLATSGTTAGGHAFATTQDLRDHFLQIAHDRKQGPSDDGERIYFLIDEATPWSRVVDAVGAAVDAGLRAPAFVFRAPSTLVPPPRTPADDDLDKYLATRPPAERVPDVLLMLRTEIASCPVLYETVAGRSSNASSRELIRRIPLALIDCKCNVSMTTVRTLLWRLFAEPDPARAILLDPAAPKQRIALPADTPWSKASTHFTAATKNVDFAIQ